MDDDAGRRDVAERAKAIYEERLRAVLKREHFGKELLIDVDSGDYEVAQGRDDYFAASDRLEARHPSSRVFVMRIGYRALARIGGARWRSDAA